MTPTPPAFGPTDPIPCDPDLAPFANVRLELAVTREQLRAALAIGHAEQAGQPPLADMSVADIRREVEGYLAAGAVLATAPEVTAVNAALTPSRAAELDAAIDRAYTLPPRPPVQNPRYRHGTVTLQTLDRGEVTTHEPGWCIGHDEETVGYYADITHTAEPVTATTVTAAHGEIDVLYAQITQAPHAVKQPEPRPVLYVALDLNASFAPEDGRALSRALRVASVRLDRALTELARLRGEQP